MTQDQAQVVAQQMARQQREAEDRAVEERAQAEMQVQGAPEAQGGSSYQDSTVAELKDELAERDLPKSGNKEDLVARLEENDRQGSEPEAQDYNQDEATDSYHSEPQQG